MPQGTLRISNSLDSDMLGILEDQKGRDLAEGKGMASYIQYIALIFRHQVL
jgi:hypothetical protein